MDPQNTPADAAACQDQPSCCCGIHDHKYRSPEEKRALANRLKRIEGQIRGLERMLDQDAYCPDILNQSQAAISALASFNKVLLAAHIRSCVTNDIRQGNDATIDELVTLLQKMMR
jgi:DNA-binding FrmR family transcriptional regulator